jgi:hypothetical protein
MKDGYPEEDELKTIETWDIKDPFGLIEFIESITWTPDWCIVVKGKRVKHFEFHTAGWSENEEIIEALQKTMFWTLYWVKTHRGGHYYFKVYKLKSNTK